MLFRSENFVSIYGDSLVASSSHNVYLDVFQGAGLISGVAYLTLNAWIFKIAFKNFWNNNFDMTYKATLVIWILIQFQSLISIQTVAISVWQWIIAGFLVSSQSTSKKNLGVNSVKNGKVEKTIKFKKWKLYIPTSACLILLLFSLLPMVQDIRFASAIKNSSGDQLLKLSSSFP